MLVAKRARRDKHNRRDKHKNRSRRVAENCHRCPWESRDVVATTRGPARDHSEECGWGRGKGATERARFFIGLLHRPIRNQKSTNCDWFKFCRIQLDELRRIVTASSSLSPYTDIRTYLGSDTGSLLGTIARSGRISVVLKMTTQGLVASPASAQVQIRCDFPVFHSRYSGMCQAH